MPVEDALFSRLNLRTNPFAPRVGDAGPIAPPVFTQELKPNLNPQLLSYYFDLYDWRDSPLVRQISRLDAFDRFERAKDRQPTMVLVSGTGGTGRGSLTNLVLYKINEVHAETPIVVEVNFSSFSRKLNLPQVASTFITVYSAEEAQPTITQLNDAFDRQMKLLGDGTDFTPVFSNLRVLVRRVSTRPIVVISRGGDHYDLWSSMFTMTSPLVDYIIVETANARDAETCQGQLSGKGAVCHVRTSSLDRATLSRWIQDRIDAERANAAAGAALSPLSAAALDALFEPGSANTGAVVRHPIGWVVDTLRKAMKHHIDTLAARGEQAVRQDPDVEGLRIPRQTVEAARKR
jgi:hypothetical protein